MYGLAKNYEAHARFMHDAGHSDIKHAPEDMAIFSKPSTSVIGFDDPIIYPAGSNDMNFEPEVAVVISRITKNVTVENAMDYVLGFTCVNDVTLRDLQGLGSMWTRAKGFDTSCPLSPWIVTRDAKISFTPNGEDVPMASGTTANLIHGIPEQIAAISSFATLLPGEVILTGTPNASGHLDPGDETVVTVEGMVSCVTWCCVREFGTVSCGAYHPDPRRCRARFYAYEKAAPAINRIRVSRTGDRGTACRRGTPMTSSSVVLASELALEEVDDSCMFLFVNLHGE